MQRTGQQLLASLSFTKQEGSEKRSLLKISQYMKNKILLLFLTIASFHACTPSQKEIGANTIRPISIASDNPKIPIDSLIEEIKYIKLETNEENLIGLISKIIFTDQHIFIADNVMANRIYMFDRNGHFLKKIGSIGNGPGEYLSIDHITLTPDRKKMVVVDDKKSQLLFYDLNGNYIESESTPYRAEIIECVDDRHRIYANTSGIYEGNADLRETLLLTDNKGAVLLSAFPSSYTPEFNLVTHSDHLRKFNDRLYYNPNVTDTIYEVSLKGIVPRYVINVEHSIRPRRTGSSALADYISFIQTERSFNGTFIDTDRFFIVGLFPNGSSPVFYDKKKAEVYQISDTFVDPLSAFWGEGEIMTCCSDDWLAAGWSAEKVTAAYEKLPAADQARLADLNISKEDNPVLFFYKLKGAGAQP